MENLDETKVFSPTVESALGKDKVVVVKSVKADLPIHSWYRDMRRNPATKQAKDAGALFHNVLQRDIDQTLSAHKLKSADDCETITFIWMQGRSDSTPELSSSYSEKLKGLIRQMKLYRKRPDINVVIARINDHDGENKDVQRVRQAQVKVATETHRATWVDTDDLNGAKNDLKCRAEGYKTLGERLAKKALKLIKNAPKGKHLFILSGQSNMYNLNGPVYFNPYVEAFYGKHNVAIAKRDRGGKPISRWYRGWKSVSGKEAPKEFKGDLYDVLMTEVKNKMSNQTFDTVTFIWMQGESDSGKDSAPVYGDSLKGLIKQLEDDLGRKDLNVVIGRINNVHAEKNPSWKMIRELQVQVAEELPSGAWVDTDDLWSKKTNVHMTKDGYRKMGQRFAKKSIGLIAKKTGFEWDDKLTDMVPPTILLTEAQKVANPIPTTGEKPSATDSGWTSIMTAGMIRPQWRHMSLDPVNDDYTLPTFDAKHFKLIDLPDALKGWTKPGFDDSNWKRGLGPIDQPMQRSKGSTVTFNSEWGDGDYLLMRTTFEMENLDYEMFRIRVLTRYGHLIYLNGHLIRSFPWYTGAGKYKPKPMNESQAIYLKHGKNTLAVYANSVDEKFTKKRDALIDVDIEGYRH